MLNVILQECFIMLTEIQEYGLLPSAILNRYLLHEADISRFVDSANKTIMENVKASPTRLQTFRKKANLTQKQLADLSAVSLRMIQLYEQRQNDINKAAASVINKLAWG